MTARILIKIGGRAFEGEAGFRELAQAIRQNPEAEVIIVHGGGVEISQALKAAGRETVFVDGMRVTRAEDIKIVESVLSGTINERIAEWLSKNRVRCRRMSGTSEGP
jgi:acetylglutamate kinase